MKYTNYKEIFNNSILIMIHKLNHKIYNKHNEILAKYDITVPQSRVLIYIILNRDNGPISQKDIEKYLNLKGSSVSSLIKNMIDKNLIIKTQNNNDGRYHNIDITEKGIKLDILSLDIFQNFNLSLIKDISENEIEQLQKILKKIELNIEN